MTTVPGTYFTEEQLETALEDDNLSGWGLTFDNISGWGLTGIDKLKHFGFVYRTKKRQYDKALAWYILAAMENNSTAYNSIGLLYYNGYGVPQNYLCALKWYLKAAEQREYETNPTDIGKLFEYGYDVPLDKYKALEWCRHGGDFSHLERLNNQGYDLSAADKKKSFQQLIKETEAILDAEKKKLEEKQDKTQEEMETLEQLNITYKLTGGGKDAWNDVPILSADDKQRYTKPVNNSDEILELKKQIQLLKQDKTNTANEMERLKSSYTILEQLLKSKEDVILSLNRENQGIQQGANEMVDTLKSLLQSKNNEIELNNLKMEHALDKEKGKIKKLLKENKRLKQTANSRETRPSSNTTVPEATSSNTRTNEDNPNNDFNYDTECGNEYSSSDDTSSEDGDHANDLNYNSNV